MTLVGRNQGRVARKNETTIPMPVGAASRLTRDVRTLRHSRTLPQEYGGQCMGE